jgi:sugar lactone lactonase YvrE
VLRVNSAGKHVLARVPFRAPWPNVTLGTSDDAVWAVSTHDVGRDAATAHPAPTTLLRIDPETNRIAARITLRAPNGSTLIPLGLTVTSSAVWVWGEGGAQRIDPDTNRITTAIRVPGGRIKGFAAGETEAWAATDIGDLVRFDADTGKRLSTAPFVALDRPQQPVVLPDALLLDRQDGTIAAIDGTTGATRWTARPGTALRGATFADARLWLLDTEALLAIDHGNGRIIARIPLPATDPLGVAAINSALLVTTSDGHVIVVRP